MAVMRSAYAALILPLMLAAPISAQPSASPADVTPAASLQVSDTVHCAYDQMSTEDREMALLLLEREVGSARKSHLDSPNLKVIERLVDEANAKCSKPYAWSPEQSEAATVYAINELRREGFAQALEAKGHSATQIDAFYDHHRIHLARDSQIKGKAAAVFFRYLNDLGWKKDDDISLARAELYLNSLLNRDSQACLFSSACFTAPRAPSRARPALVSRRGEK